MAELNGAGIPAAVSVPEITPPATPPLKPAERSPDATVTMPPATPPAVTLVPTCAQLLPLDAG